MFSANPSSDAITDAWLWLERELKGRPVPSVLVVVGFGDGLLLDAMEAHAPDTRVLALEPDSVNRKRFLASRTGREWRHSGRVVYLADPDYAGADEAWRLFPSAGGKPIILTHPELARCEGLGRARDVLKRILFGVEANAAARRRFAPGYLTNSIRNVPAMLRGSDLTLLTDKYRGVPAVIAGAGPSLDAAIQPLQGLADRALLIAADTALRPLLTAGVTPQLVVGMDAGAANLRHFLSLPECRNTWLVSESALDPNAARVFADRTFWFRVSNHQPWPWLNGIGVDIGTLDVWGSVLTGAFQVACLAGCNPIIIVGADLAYTSGRPYARGTTYEFDWAWYSAYGRELSSTWDHLTSGAKLLDTLDLNQAETQTTQTLQSYRDWMVARAGKSGRRVINAGRAGILFGDSIEHLPLTGALPDRREITPVGKFAHPASGVRPSTVAANLRSIRSAVAMGERAADPIGQWVEFSGAGFDPVALVTALDHAVAALETPPQPPGTSPSRWAAFVSDNASAQRLRTLPEATLRLRAGLNGQLPLPASADCTDAVERAALLARALHELARICELVLQEQQDVRPIVNLPVYGQTPVALNYAWPDEQRWAIQTFEAMLGGAWTPPVGDAAAPLSSRPGRARGDLETPPIADENPRPHAARACRQLVAEWLRCARGLEPSTTNNPCRVDVHRLTMLETLLNLEAPRDATPGQARLRLCRESQPAVELPLGVSAALLARLLIGTLRASDDAPYAIAQGLLSGFKSSLHIAPPSRLLTAGEPERRRTATVQHLLEIIDDAR